MGGQPHRYEREGVRGLLREPWESDTREGVLGPSTSTLRDVAYPRGWLGLSAGDRDLLVPFLAGLDPQPDELHTHVPVGSCPRLRPEHDTRQWQDLVRGVYPRRVDAALRFGRGWWLVEAKVDANHYVIGQVLCYAFWWREQLGGKPLSEVVVVTDQVDPDTRRVMLAAGIRVVEIATGQSEKGSRIERWFGMFIPPEGLPTEITDAPEDPY